MKNNEYRLNQVTTVNLLGRTVANRYDIQPGTLYKARDINSGSSELEAGIIIFLFLLWQANKYLPLCELFHVFSDTGGWFLCDRHAPESLQSFLYGGLCLQAGGRSVLCCTLLPSTSLCADNRRFVGSCYCQMVTEILSFPQNHTQFSMVCASWTVPV